MRGVVRAGLVAVVAAGLQLVNAADARACGGCFHQDPLLTPNPQPSVVTGHRMAIAISPTQTTLWDQVQYDGNPDEFAWVLPVRPGARLELANNAFFETLEAVTTVVVAPPKLNCSATPVNTTNGSGGGAGCGATPSGSNETLASSASSSSGGSNNNPDMPVQVLSQQTVGPYDTVTVRSTQVGALAGWLRANQFAIPVDVEPVVNAYETEHFDFLALRLRPGQGVQAMKPVRVVYPGTLLSFPLRMVSAGTASTVGLVLYVLAEGRWGVQSGTNVEVDPRQLSFDFSTSSSNYEALKSSQLAQNSGNAWLTAYARRGALFNPVLNPITGQNAFYLASNSRLSTDSTAAGLYVSQGLTNMETTDQTCKAALLALASDGRTVVDPCDETGYCRDVHADEVDARTLRCGGLDDLSVALTGNRPGSMWITRLEARLPRSALAQDLALSASTTQTTVENNLAVHNATNSPCPLATAMLETERRNPINNLGNLLTLWGPTMLGAVVMRRVLRRKP